MVSSVIGKHAHNILAFCVILDRCKKGTRTGALKISISFSCYGNKKVKYKSQICILKVPLTLPDDGLPYCLTLIQNATFPFGDLSIPDGLSFSSFWATNRYFLLLFISKAKVIWFQNPFYMDRDRWSLVTTNSFHSFILLACKFRANMQEKKAYFSLCKLPTVSSFLYPSKGVISSRKDGWIYVNFIKKVGKLRVIVEVTFSLFFSSYIMIS